MKRLPVPGNAADLVSRLASRSMEIPSLVPGLALPCWVIVTQPAAIDQNAYTQTSGVPTHRVAYSVMIGDIPDGLVLDHLCDFKPCWNPWHLDPVTEKINIRRARRIRSNRRKQVTGCSLVDGRWISTYRYVPAKHVRERKTA